MSLIPLSTPDTGSLEEQYVLAALRSGWVAPAGPDLTAFESEVAERVGVEHAVGLSSGTAALHLALVSWGVGPGDVVPVSTLTFAATANAVRYTGAEPHFVDADLQTGNMRPELLAEALTDIRRKGRSVPAVVPVDLLGACVDYDRISAVCAEHGVRLLADAAESFGATFRGRPAGSFGDASVISFNGNKIMTTSGGGMLLTGDAALAAHVRKLSTQAREPVVHYEHTEVGYNYRLSNILAALGRAQLRRLDEMIARRRGWRARYRALVEDLKGVRVLGGPDAAADEDDNCWLTAIVIEDESGLDPGEVADTLTSLGVETRPVWKPMHLQPVYAAAGATIDGTAERLFRLGLTLPSGSALTDDQFATVEDALRKALGC